MRQQGHRSLIRPRTCANALRNNGSGTSSMQVLRIGLRTYGLQTVSIQASGLETAERVSDAQLGSLARVRNSLSTSR
ncbi:hypothetical protein PCAR4_570253 [Paraburkholderia caribensis]|nr:hypothetical protein PCAR4_570253 [Paraburkholderia caribensis]